MKVFWRKSPSRRNQITVQESSDNSGPGLSWNFHFSVSKNHGGIPVCNFMSFLQSITSFLLLCLLSRHQLGWVYYCNKVEDKVHFFLILNVSVKPLYLVGHIDGHCIRNMQVWTLFNSNLYINRFISSTTICCQQTNKKIQLTSLYFNKKTFRWILVFRLEINSYNQLSSAIKLAGVLFADSDKQSQPIKLKCKPSPIREYLFSGFLCISSTSARNSRWFHPWWKINARPSNFIFDHVHNFISHYYHRKVLTDRGSIPHILEVPRKFPLNFRFVNPWLRNTSWILFVWCNVLLDDISLLSVNDPRIKG